MFQGLCSALHAFDQGLVCSSNCNIETMKEASFYCYYILLPSDKGLMLIRVNDICHFLFEIAQTFVEVSANSYLPAVSKTMISSLVNSCWKTTSLFVLVKCHQWILSRTYFFQVYPSFIGETESRIIDLVGRKGNAGMWECGRVVEILGGSDAS